METCNLHTNRVMNPLKPKQIALGAHNTINLTTIITPLYSILIELIIKLIIKKNTYLNK